MNIYYEKCPFSNSVPFKRLLVTHAPLCVRFSHIRTQGFKFGDAPRARRAAHFRAFKNCPRKLPAGTVHFRAALLCLVPCSHRNMSDSAASAASQATTAFVPLVLAPHSVRQTAAKITPVSKNSWHVSSGEAVPDFFGSNGPGAITQYNRAR